MVQAEDTGVVQSENMLDSPMMAHLHQNLEKGTDVGHYGRLVYVMVARHFQSDDEMAELLAKQPDHNEDEARALIAQVEGRDYNPPRREKILAWQAEQEFPIIPDPEDPQSGNVYRELKFPGGIYDNIGEFWEEKTETHESTK